MRALGLLCCLLITGTGAIAAEAEPVEAGDDTAIPTLTPEVLDAWWPGLSPHLPKGFVSGSGEAMPGARGHGPMASGSLWAGGIAHPSSRWSWGAAVGVSERRWGMGPIFPDRSRTVRLAAGAWRRFSLDDHLVLVAAPGIGWSDGDGPVGVSAPVAALWVHRSGRRLVWGAGMVALIGAERPIAFPVAGLIAMEGPWTFVVTPLFLSAERLLDADSAVAAFAGISADEAPIEAAGRRFSATYIDVRAGLRARTKLTEGLSLGGELGCAIWRRAAVVEDGVGGEELADIRPAAAPYAALSATWSW